MVNCLAYKFSCKLELSKLSPRKWIRNEIFIGCLNKEIAFGLEHLVADSINKLFCRASSIICFFHRGKLIDEFETIAVCCGVSHRLKGILEIVPSSDSYLSIVGCIFSFLSLNLPEHIVTCF